MFVIIFIHSYFIYISQGSVEVHIIMWLLCISSHFNCIFTLPCEI